MNVNVQLQQVTIADMKAAIKAMKNPLKMEDKVLEKCVSLVNRASLSVGDFLDHVESFSVTQNVELTNDVWGQFERTLLENSSKSKSKNSSTPSKSPMPSSSSSLGKRALETPGPTDTSGMSNNTGASSQSNFSHQSGNTSNTLESTFNHSQVVDYSARTTSGQKAADLNPTLCDTRGTFEPSDIAPLGVRVRVRNDEDDFFGVKSRYRYMFTSLDERARALDSHLLNMQDQMCEMASIAQASLQPVGIPSQDTVWVCGRICCDAAEGKLNKMSVILEGSRRDSGGRRVHLELSEAPSYSLFPGQIVMVEGVNSSGRKMVARRIIEGCRLPTLKTPPAKLLEYHHSSRAQGGKALSVFTAAGPFTTSKNLEYEPLLDLLKLILKKKPDVVILMGPFVDVSQPLLTEGSVTLTVDEDESTAHEASYEMVFVEKIVRDGLQLLFNQEDEGNIGKIPTNIILVPSLLDAHHEYVFPQPPFGDRDRVRTEFFEEDLGVLDIPYSRDSDGNKKRVHLLPNPCMFRINEVLFAATSNDVLFSLSSDEVSFGHEGNRLARLSAHLLLQQTFCPQFPVPPSTPWQVDLRQHRHFEFKKNPDVLILPSRLAVLAKEVMGTLVVNPGQLAKGASGGTYAELTINPIEEKTITDASIAAMATSSSSSSGSGNGFSGVKVEGGGGSGSDGDVKANGMAHHVASRTGVIIKKI